MEKLKMHSPDLTEANIDKIAELFPSVVTECRDADGQPKRAINFDLLRQELSDHIIEGAHESYQLDWPGKRAAAFAANAPIAKTLRPVRHESVDFDSTKNIFIEGDNLEALKLLQESYLGKVKLIYIDPPYNTSGNFIYMDDFASTRTEYLETSGQTNCSGEHLVSNPDSNGRFHSDWLSMMYPRLKRALSLLSEDGVLVVSIDENEHANLVTLATEVLGRGSYVGEIVLKNSSRNDQRYISVQHEYIVFFVKNKAANLGNWTERKGGLEKIYAAFERFKMQHGEDWEAIHNAAKAWYKTFPPSDPVFASKHYNRIDRRGIYFADNVSGPNDGQYVYDLVHPVTGRTVKRPSRGWYGPKESLEQAIADDRIHFGPDETTVPNSKTYLKDTENQSLTSIRYVDGRAASKRLQALFGEKMFTNPKDEFLLKDIYKALGLAGEDIVLDMFAGSASASDAVLQLNVETGSNCHFIAIQVAEDLHESLKNAKGAAKKITADAIKLLEGLGKPTTVAEIGKQRLRLVGEKIRDKAPLLDRGFRSLKVDTTNMKDLLRTPDATDAEQLALAVRSVKEGRTSEDLLFQVLLDWGLPLDLPIVEERLAGAEVFVVDEGAVIACFAESVSKETVIEMAKRQPLRAVFRDSAFATDADRINAEQIFKQHAPSADLKAI